MPPQMNNIWIKTKWRSTVCKNKPLSAVCHVDIEELPLILHDNVVSRFGGIYWCISLKILPQPFSKAEVWTLDHRSFLFIPFLFSHSVADLVVWLGSLSFCVTQLKRNSCCQTASALIPKYFGIQKSLWLTPWLYGVQVRSTLHHSSRCHVALERKSFSHQQLATLVQSTFIDPRI